LRAAGILRPRRQRLRDAAPLELPVDVLLPEDGGLRREEGLLRGGEPGDLYVVTRVTESPIFKRKGDNLEVEVPLTIPEALRGATVEVPTLHGSKRLRVPAGTEHGTMQRLRNEGPPKLDGKGRGDIHYRFVLDVPDSLNQEQQRAVDELSKVMNGNPRERLFSARES
jgi:molecular chaperone DnaJ